MLDPGMHFVKLGVATLRSITRLPEELLIMLLFWTLLMTEKGIASLSFKIGVEASGQRLSNTGSIEC